MKRIITLAFMVVAFVALTASGAMAAKLLCVSHQNLKGETTVSQCLNKGMEFAIVDTTGFVRILTPREVELTKRINPQAFETPGFSLQYYKQAPEVPPLPVSPEIQ